MGSYTIFEEFENPRRGRPAINLTTNVLKILDFKSSSEQIFFQKLLFGAPGYCRAKVFRKAQKVWDAIYCLQG